MKKGILGLLCLMLLASCADSNAGDMEAHHHYSKALGKAKDLTVQEDVQMKDENARPEYLYKIVSAEDWQKSQLQNQVVNSPLDKDFIHLSMEGQLSHVAQKFWNNGDHITLKLDANKLSGRLVYETNPGGITRYYHLYEGNIPLDSVVDVSLVHATNNEAH